MLESALGERSGHPVRIRSQVRSTRARWLEHGGHQCQAGAGAAAGGRRVAADQLEQLAEASACRLAGAYRMLRHQPCKAVKRRPPAWFSESEGPVKADYRRFNIEGVEPGDDYGAIAQAVRRRYGQVRKGGGGAARPDIHRRRLPARAPWKS